MDLSVDERIHQQLRLFDAISSSTPDFLYAFDPAGKLVYANRRLLEVWGKTEHEAFGKSLYELGYPRWHADMHVRELARVVETRRPIMGAVPVAGGNGIAGVYEYFLTPVCDADGRVEVVAGTARHVTERPELLSALTAERSKLAAVIEQAPAFMAVLRGPEHVVELANDRYREIVGRSRSILGKPVREVMPEVAAQGYFERIDEVYRTGRTFAGTELPVRVRRGGDGDEPEPRHINLVYQAIREADGTVSGIFVHGFDVTDLVAAREALRLSEQRWQLAVRGSNDGIWDWDVVADGLYWSPRCKEMLGYADDELSVTPASARDLVHPDDRAAAQAAFGRHLSGEAPSLAIEHRLRHKDGSYRWVLARGLAVRDADGRAARMVGSHTDVTVRKGQELAQLHLAAIVASSDDAIISKTLDGVIQTWNAGAQRIFGYTAAETVGRPVLMLLPPDRYPEEDAILARLRAGERLDHYESVRMTKDGRLIDVSLTISPMRDATGRIVGASKVARDITRQKQSERELQAAKAAADAANRRKDELLESERAARTEADRASRMKDEFLATLSHELRTPLNAILGWSQVARRHLDDAVGVADALGTIERNARTQAQIIDDLLDMSRIISGKIRLDVQRLDLSAVVRAAVETVTPATDAKNIRLQVVLDPRAGPVSGDPNRLQQVFWNLMTNAVKFTPKGGRVQVVLERINSHLEVSVTDTGEGIAAEFLPHVFDRFRQADASTSRRHGGLGLGLAIVKQLVELHGGTVRVQSGGPGAGSTFTVALPLTVVHPHPTPGDADRRHPAAGGSPDLSDACGQVEGVRVLVVDDEPDARALVRRVLEDCRAVVTTAASADEALGHVIASRPDVLVSDIGMPGEDGYSLIARVRALGPDRGGDVPAVALTAYARAEDRIKAIRAGFEQHLVKPVEPAELITLVSVLAARRRR